MAAVTISIEEYRQLQRDAEHDPTRPPDWLVPDSSQNQASTVPGTAKPEIDLHQALFGPP